MKSQEQALVIIALAFSALMGILAAAGEAGMTCSCGTPIGFPPACVVTPCPGRELLTMDSYKINSPTNVTLTIRNIGDMGIGFSSYTVSQSNSVQYTYNNWTEPMLQPNQVFGANILINGAPFTFQSGLPYTVTIVTTRNNQFTFTIQG